MHRPGPSLLAALVFASLALACGSKTQADWVVVSQDMLVVGVEVSGALRATDSARVGPPGLQDVWEYKVSAMAPEGEVVKAGDMLLSFDTESLREQLLAEENRRDATKVSLEKRRHEIMLADRDAALQLAEAEAAVRKAGLSAEQSDEFTGNLILRKAKLDLDAANEQVEHLRTQGRRQKTTNQGEISNLSAQVEDAESKVAGLEKSIERMTVKASRAGTVIYASNRGQEKYKVGDRVWRAASILEVASLDSMMAEGTIDEADSARLEPGQSVQLRLEAHPDSEVKGTIIEIARNVQRKSPEIPTKVVAVKLSIEPVKGLQLRPGMRFRGEVEIERIQSAVLVPQDVVFGSAAGPIAFLKTGDGAERRQLVLGKHGKRGVQVLEGLSSGDRVSLIDLSVRSKH